MQEDELLHAYLTTRDETLASRHLECMFQEHVLPIVTAIVESRFHVSLRRPDRRTQSQVEQDAEDLRARVILDLAERLEEIRRHPSGPPLQDFRAYVAASTYRAFGRHLAGRYRTRAALREQLRYLLTHREEFACWTQESSKFLCGFAHWRIQHQIVL